MQYIPFAAWMLIPAGVCLAAGILLLEPAFLLKWKQAIAVLLLLSTLVIPAWWSVQTVLISSSGQSLPAAYAGETRDFGKSRMNEAENESGLLDYLQTNTQGVKYLVAVDSSTTGAPYVLATGRPVLYMGGIRRRRRSSGRRRIGSPCSEGRAALRAGRRRHGGWRHERQPLGHRRLAGAELHAGGRLRIRRRGRRRLPAGRSRHTVSLRKLTRRGLPSCKIKFYGRISALMPPSSRGPGRSPFKAKTRVRISLGAPGSKKPVRAFLFNSKLCHVKLCKSEKSWY